MNGLTVTFTQRHTNRRQHLSAVGNNHGVAASTTSRRPLLVVRCSHGSGADDNAPGQSANLA